MLKSQAAIVRVLARAEPEPVLLSDMGRLIPGFNDLAFEALHRAGIVIAVFPEAQPGHSGRQYWRLFKDRR